MKHYAIIIVGGGNAGISVAARILGSRKDLDLAIIEPSDKHYYQPAWTLAGAGEIEKEKTVRHLRELIPQGATWIREKVIHFNPDRNQVGTEAGTYSYDFLIAAPGIQLNWSEIPGLPEALGSNCVTTTYNFNYLAYTHQCIREIEAGQTAIFTSPTTPVKCSGAALKIMYLAADYFRRHNVHAHVDYFSPHNNIFSIRHYVGELMKKIVEYEIRINFKHELVSIDGPNKTAKFRVTDANGVKSEVLRPFDMIHVTPPQSAPDCIRYSKLADENGWIDVDQDTLIHRHYQNVFGLGDAIGTANAKTGAAVRKQSPVVVSNLFSLLRGEAPSAKYNGYGSCPITVGFGQLILAEYDYESKPLETFPFDQSKPRWSMWMMMKYFMPWLYWNKILKGKA